MEDITLGLALTALAAASPGGPDQVAYVVDDLESGLTRWRDLGYNDWLIYTYSENNVPKLHYHGEPASTEFRLALSGNSPQIELIQSVRGDNIYVDWLQRNEPGVHHIGFFVDKIAPIQELFVQAGRQPIQAGAGYGLDGDGSFTYFDLTDTPMRTVLELIEIPRRRRPSETVGSFERLK